MVNRTGDAEWDRKERNETPTQRLDRNWASLLQELRVVQTGVQLLTGFLLTVPFQDLFYSQDTTFQNIYLITVTASVGATVLLLAPVAMHRLLFRRHRLEELVNSAQRFALGGLVLLGVALTGVMTLVFEMVVSRSAGVIAGAMAVVLFLFFWFAFPWHYRRLDREQPAEERESVPDSAAH
jgi:Na+/melibiose symporter-like transporter